MMLALYDLRSKQEYIYRTNKIREISGGSALLSAVYERFISKAQDKENGIWFVNNGGVSVPCSVLPFTQVDMQTYMPIVEKRREKEAERSLSRESVCKLEACKTDPDDPLSEIYLDDLAADKGRESLLAIIYIDGNNMGAKLMQALGKERNYDQCINVLRRFSEQTAHDFVEAPIAAIEGMLVEKQAAGISYAKYRRVIAGGDEITLICNARIVPEILDVYFNTLDSRNSKNYACAGVAIFHSHAPFADVYEIAEQCCESGKKCSRKYQSDANFIDFHYCRAGITNDMEVVRERQEKGLTARPYRVDGEHEGYSYTEFIGFAKMIKAIGRANIKELATALIKGESYYRFEIERLNSRFKDIHIDPADERTRKMVFDTAQVYDLWFAGEGDK